MLLTSWTLLTLVSLVLSAGPQEDRVEPPTCEFLVTKWTTWSNPVPGLAATIELPVFEDIESWTVVLEFNKRFTKLNYFNAVSEAITGSQYQLTNQDWSGKKKVGDHVKFSLLGDYEDSEDSEPVSVIRIVLNDQTMCQARQ